MIRAFLLFSVFICLAGGSKHMYKSDATPSTEDFMVKNLNFGEVLYASFEPDAGNLNPFPPAGRNSPVVSPDMDLTQADGHSIGPAFSTKSQVSAAHSTAESYGLFLLGLLAGVLFVTGGIMVLNVVQEKLQPVTK